MTDRDQYTPGPATGAQVRKDRDKWTLILVLDRLEDHFDGCVPADMLKRFADLRSLYV